MRPLISIAATGAAVVVAIGCGSSDPPRARAPLTSISRSRAHVVAPLLTIRTADLPEFKVTGHAATGEGREDARFAHCLPASARTRLRPLGPWGSASSERVSVNDGYHLLGAHSGASIMPTPALARREVGEVRKLNTTCLEHALRAQAAGRRLPFPLRGVTVEPLLLNVKGADTTAAYRVIAAYRGAPLLLYMDAVEFAYGQDAIELLTYHASKPVPPAMEERLLGLLLARAKSHSR